MSEEKPFKKWGTRRDHKTYVMVRMTKEDRQAIEESVQRHNEIFPGDNFSMNDFCLAAIRTAMTEVDERQEFSIETLAALHHLRRLTQAERPNYRRVMKCIGDLIYSLHPKEPSRELSPRS